MTFRFFVPKNTFSVSECIDLPDEEYHHARHVLRILENEVVSLHNGEGLCAEARVVTVDKKKITLIIENVVSQTRPSCTITLILAYLRPGHLDFALEKCTELGVDTVALYHAEKSDRTEIRPSSRKRYEHLITAAMKQSGRFFLPTITTHLNLENALATNNYPCIYCDLEDNSPYIDEKLHSLPPSSISIVIGPESGFTQLEKDLLRRSGASVLLHDTVLRAETAAICACFAASLWRHAKKTP